MTFAVNWCYLYVNETDRPELQVYLCSVSVAHIKVSIRARQ